MKKIQTVFVSDKKRNHHNLSWADFATVQGMSSHGLTKRGSKVFLMMMMALTTTMMMVQVFIYTIGIKLKSAPPVRKVCERQALTSRAF